MISKILKPADKRLTLEEIFAHPWMNKEIPNTALKVSFRKMHEYSKFSKVIIVLSSLKNLPLPMLLPRCLRKMLKNLEKYSGKLMPIMTVLLVLMNLSLPFLMKETGSR